MTVESVNYRVTAGAPSRFQSSPGVTRTFCAACGTQLTYQRSDEEQFIDVTLCSLDEPDALAPQDHTFTQYRLSWDMSADGKPEYLRLRDGL